MGNIFSGSEIVEIGVQIEKNGRDFYREVSACAKDEPSKKVFDYLGNEEEHHITTFREMLSSVQNYEPKEAYPGEYFAYMKALADDHVFTKENAGCELGKKVGSEKEAIGIAIRFEKDSILFYEGMKKVVPEKDHRLLEALINEEQKHIRELNELKELLT